MLRKIIRIDAEKCNGCGACVNACHEGAIVMRDGKVALLRDDYCDGLGDCLPACPTDAISFEVREALPYDEQAVLENMRKAKKTPPSGGCPGSMSRRLGVQHAPVADTGADQPSCLGQWPVQLRLVPTNAAFFDNARLLLAADCTAFAFASFHRKFMTGKVTLIGCPKLDPVDYAEKLTTILTDNTVASLEVVRMSVPCCGGIADAAARAVQKCGKAVDFSVVTITPEGKLLATPAEGLSPLGAR